MRTTVMIKDELDKDMIPIAGGRSKTAAINNALADWVRLKKIQELRSLRGKLAIAGDLAKFRSLDIGKD
ncbi:MAG: type II toxin-antitoxin system VapB family antitoxin [Candidatus Sumerlaeota bacterium]|nr:type II toxin-antitoxin system VapB family antitoxin [Candidatus Sumerlaeota bacterium]